jgi:hypothetical protein
MCFEKSHSERLSHHGSNLGIAGRILLGLMVSSALSGVTLAQSSAHTFDIQGTFTTGSLEDRNADVRR